ncbi:MAG TPA: 3-hydroxyacyl-CoA dehydrogenase family protein [Candidatus Deferrimicrobium sp.]|nr:3-hydroxyacyl-CoA dehydrogenase family protein [Candidatus Kapabacteria bacterium]HLP57739.1 3-hydroxyacyl-CoA dehydrogenase family protein [Candidatus Deferrimicrobium sp.]
MTFKLVGVIGAGTMGVGVTVDLVFHGIHSVLVDISSECLEKAKTEIIKQIRFAPLLYKDAPKMQVEDALKQVTFTTHLEDVKDCEFVVENVPEDWEIKKKVYLELDRICKPETYFGVDTSCISITRVGSLTQRPDKIVGVHFMNPSYLKPVIEVMQGFHTSDDCLEKTKALLTQLGKEAIVVKDFPGFVSNRISHLFMNEAAFVYQDGVARAEQIDNIFKKCFGHKMGPLETADLIGLDTVMKSLDVLYESYQDPKFRCCPLLRKMVDAGLLGRKSGKGFYNYSNQ